MRNNLLKYSFSEKHLKYLFQPSFWPDIPELREYEMNSTEGIIYLSDPRVSSLEILFPKQPLVKFLNNNNIESKIEDLFSYKSKTGDIRVIDSIIHFQNARFGQELKRENILQTIGSTNAIDLAISVILKQGDSILIPVPSYFIFWKSAVSRGFRYDIFFCGEQNRFIPTLENIKQNLKPDTRVVGLIQPLFPSGFRMDTNELINIIDFLAKKKIFTVLDLVYDLLTYRDKKVISTDDELGRCFTRNLDYLVQVNSFSKTWSAPGIRFGYLVASEYIVREGAVKLVSTVGRCPVFLAPLYKYLIDGTTQMLTDTDSEFRKILMRNTSEYKIRAKELIKMTYNSGLEVLMSDAGFNLFVKLPKVPNNFLEQWKFLNEIYDNFGIIFDYGSLFGIPHHPMIPTYIRVNLGIPKERLFDGMKKLASFYLSYIKR